MQISIMRRAAVAVVGLALIGAACGSSSNKNSAGGSSTTASGGAATSAGAGGGAGAVTMPTGAKCSGISLGFFGAYTGENSGLGIPIYNGAKLAIDEFNAANPGCKVGYNKYDSQGDPTQAPQLARSIVGDNAVVGVVGPAFSGESKAANPIFNDAGLPIVTPSATNAQLQNSGWTIFHRMLANDDTQGPGIATYIKDTVKAQKVYVIDDASDYGKGLATTVKSTLGSLVVGSDTIDPKATDYSSTVTKVKAADPDAVFFGGYYANAGPLSKQLRDGGVTKAALVFGDGVKDAKYVQLAGDAGNGAIITCTCSPSPASFADAYKKAFSTDPGTYAPEAFDSAFAFLNAIAAGKTTRKDINDYLKTINIPGITKQIKFDDKGEVAVKSVYVYKVSNGQITPSGTVGS
jgi:branched-chain amino acid transport system substrate-binding protein